MVTLVDPPASASDQSGLGEEQLRNLFESIVIHANDVVLVTEAEPVDLASGGPKVLYVNPAFTRMTGYEPHEIVGKTPRIMQTADTDRRELDRLRTALRRWRPVEVELLNRHKDGTEFWVQINITPVADSTGWWTHWVAVQRDITVRKKREIAVRALLENSSDLILTMDVAGLVQAASPTSSRILGVTPEQLVGQLLVDRLHCDDQSLLAAMLAPHSVVRLGQGAAAELRLQHEDGSWRWVEVGAVDLEAEQGSVVLSCVDVTERKRSETALRLANDRFRSSFRDAPIGMALTTPSGEFVQVNEALAQLLGRTQSDLLTITIQDVMHPDDRLPSERQRTALAHGSITSHRYETRFMHSDGSVVGVLHSSSVVPGSDGGPPHLIDHIEDITERKVFENQLRHQALHDSLTGLPNRALLSDRLDRALRTAVRTQNTVAVLFVDLDRFKVINDTLGHQSGDEVLVAVARRLESIMRPGDTVARCGGDEFVVLCDGCSAEQAALAAVRIARTLEPPVAVRGTEVLVTASVGIALSRIGAGTADDLMRDADAAMYSAKDRGRSRYEVYDQVLGARATARLQLEGELRHGIGAGQLRLHYQPEVRLRDGVVVGLEALVRWQHPKRGLLLPAEFLELAEETGIIYALGEWVLDEAVREASRLPREPTAPTMWVNLSAHQLQDRAFLKGIERRLHESALPRGALGLEITESVLMQETDGATQALQTLKDLGVVLAIDDFGTGYSSLSYLARFPIDTVKIDQSFTAGLDQDETRRESYAIVSAVVGLAHALRLDVIAEGIETPSQAQALHGLGCDTGQGYLLGRPGPDGAPAGFSPLGRPRS